MNRFLLIAVCAWLPLAAAAAEQADPVHFDKGVAHIHSHGMAIRIAVEKAVTQEQQQRGLMYRKSLVGRHGMLFLFPRETVIQFWMKDTYIPLDMLFIDAHGRIVNIVARAKPLSEDPISSVAPACAVLELPAGSVKRYSIRKGDHVTYD